MASTMPTLMGTESSIKVSRQYFTMDEECDEFGAFYLGVMTVIVAQAIFVLFRKFDR